MGVVLMHHGLITFGDTAQESYERTIQLVGRAEEYLSEHGAWRTRARDGSGAGRILARRARGACDAMCRAQRDGR